MKNNFKLILITIIIFCFSCKKEPDLSENRGTPFSSKLPASWVNWMNLTWSKNSYEIIINGSFGIEAINFSTHDSRSIEKADGVYNLQLSNDEKKIYYIMTGSNLYSDTKPLFSISLDGQNRQLMVNNAFVADFCLSNTNLIAYHSSADSLYLYDFNSKSNTFLTLGNPITFSPDGKLLLYSTSEGMNTISTETKIVQHISLPEDIFLAYLTRWDESGIRIFYRGTDLSGFYVKNLTTNELWKISSNTTPDNGFMAWSPDGSKIAFWSQKCIKSSGFLECEILQSILHLIDINKRKETRIAYGNNVEDNYTGSIAFSPNSTKIVYVLGYQIYTRDIP